MPLLKAIWGKITGADKKLKHIQQQGVSLGRVSDLLSVMPYGYYIDAPNDTLFYKYSASEMTPITVIRPEDSAQGEPTFFHPLTNTRIIVRNNGDLDIIAQDGDTPGNLNITCVNATITASSTVVIDTPIATFTTDVKIDGNLEVDGNTTLSSTVTSGGTDISDTHTHDGSPTAPTGLVSPTGAPV